MALFIYLGDLSYGLWPILISSTGLCVSVQRQKIGHVYDKKTVNLSLKSKQIVRKKEIIYNAGLAEPVSTRSCFSLSLLVFPQRQRPAHFPVTISSNMPEQQHNQCNQFSQCILFFC